MAQQSLDKGKIKFLLLEGVHPSAVATPVSYTHLRAHET